MEQDKIPLKRELSGDALVVFLSDSHIGGDPGCDAFESPGELRDLLQELSEREGPVELVLSGDFFDLLQISAPPPWTDRVKLTIDRPEYQEMFGALRSFAAGEMHRVVYMPGNHDAETWWNPYVQKTLRESGLVDEFALSYLVSLGEAGEEEFVVYCEHGNQFDPPNHIEDYSDPLNTPLGHHVVTDLARKIAPMGEVMPGLDLSDVKNVYPLDTIPQWFASKYFYNTLGRAATYLAIPFLLIYVAYRAATLFLEAYQGDPLSFFRSYTELPRTHEAFFDVAFFLLSSLVLFALLFLALRRRVHKLVSTFSARSGAGDEKATEPEEVEALVREGGPLPMLEGEAPLMDVFVSGHTHSPGLKELERANGDKAVVVNSGCWLRQLQPVGSHLRWPPVFASRFVLTHVRVFLRSQSPRATLRVELWEHPKPATNPLSRTERLAGWGKMPDQPGPGTKPRAIAASEIPASSGYQEE